MDSIVSAESIVENLVVFVATVPVLLFCLEICKYVLHRSQRQKTAQELVLMAKVPQVNVLCLPQEVQGVIFSFAGMAATNSSSSTCKAYGSSIWCNPTIWSSIVSSLGVAPEQGASVQSLQNTVRRILYGIDELCQRSLCKHGRIMTRGDQCTQLQQAMRACTGLSFEDGAEIADQVIGYCLELLVTFNIDETEARCHAKQLTDIVSMRTDVFSLEQCHKVETAFSDAMDVHQLLSDVMLNPAESEMALDEAMTPPFDVDIWGEESVPCGPTSGFDDQDGSHCHPDVDAALDRLIAVLRGIVDADKEPVTAE